jgi:hypothetical protein
MIKYVYKNGKRYVNRQGRLIELGPDETKATVKKGAPFSIEWAKFPRRWEIALRKSKRVSTYQLALVILFEASNLEIKGRGGEKITLSSAVTGMPRNTRANAIKELVEFNLIEVEQNGKEAPRVYLKHGGKKRPRP